MALDCHAAGSNLGSGQWSLATEWVVFQRGHSGQNSPLYSPAESSVRSPDFQSLLSTCRGALLLSTGDRWPCPQRLDILNMALRTHIQVPGACKCRLVWKELLRSD
jgi:hypothetical protein